MDKRSRKVYWFWGVGLVTLAVLLWVVSLALVVPWWKFREWKGGSEWMPLFSYFVAGVFLAWLVACLSGAAVWKWTRSPLLVSLHAAYTITLPVMLLFYSRAYCTTDQWREAGFPLTMCGWIMMDAGGGHRRQWHFGAIFLNALIWLAFLGLLLYPVARIGVRQLVRREPETER